MTEAHNVEAWNDTEKLASLEVGEEFMVNELPGEWIVETVEENPRNYDTFLIAHQRGNDHFALAFSAGASVSVHELEDGDAEEMGIYYLPANPGITLVTDWIKQHREDDDEDQELVTDGGTPSVDEAEAVTTPERPRPNDGEQSVTCHDCDHEVPVSDVEVERRGSIEYESRVRHRGDGQPTQMSIQRDRKYGPKQVDNTYPAPVCSVCRGENPEVMTDGGVSECPVCGREHDDFEEAGDCCSPDPHIMTDGGQPVEDEEDEEEEMVDITVPKDDIAEYCCFHALEGDEYDLCSTIRESKADWIQEICPENVNHIEVVNGGEVVAWGEFEIPVAVEHIPATRHSPPETRTRSRKVMFEAKAKLGEWGDGYLRIE